MPGNEVGDRVHNFFGQENLSQGQHHSQPIDGNWPGLSNNLWVEGQRQIGGPFISGLKNYNVQQPGSNDLASRQEFSTVLSCAYLFISAHDFGLIRYSFSF